MRIEIKSGNNSSQGMFLAPETILKYLISDNDQLDTLIMCKSSEVKLFTSDHSLYEAIASIKPHDTFKLNKLSKLFEVVSIVPHNKEKTILKHERVDELRGLAMKDNAKKELKGG